MATDHYGNKVYVGDRVTKVGSSGEFIVSGISYQLGEELLDLDGSWHESMVRPSNVIKK